VPSASAWDPPDEDGAAARAGDDVDRPERPIAVEALLEEAGDLRELGLAARRRSELGCADVPGHVEVRVGYPGRLLGAAAELPGQLRDRGDPLADQVPQLVEGGGAGAEGDELAGVAGDPGALEVEDRLVLGPERDGPDVAHPAMIAGLAPNRTDPPRRFASYSARSASP